jgi:hypothetical protein
VTDELEQRLRAADPVPPTVPVDRARSPRARDLVEQIMTDTADHPDPHLAVPRRRWPALAAAAAVAVAGVAGAVALTGDDDEPSAEPIALSVAADDITQMCIEVTPETLGDPGVELAFKGTVTALDGDQATLAVDTWYRGGPADEVILTGPAETDTALLGAVPLEDGESYLISAADGAVRSCGQSGPVSPELQAIYDEAFGG